MLIYNVKSDTSLSFVKVRNDVYSKLLQMALLTYYFPLQMALLTSNVKSCFMLVKKIKKILYLYWVYINKQ